MRYSRQLALPEIGPQGQARLQSSKVTVVGAGGLGTPASLYLAAAGVGHITIIDPDTVAMSNLSRQVLYDQEQVGASKALLLADRLRRFNPEIEVEGLVLRLTSAEKAAQFLNRDGCDVVVDATDNNQTRLLINRVTVQAGLPLIYGAVHSFYGQIMTIVPGRGPCLGCLLPSTEFAPESEPYGASAVCQLDGAPASVQEEGGGVGCGGRHEGGGIYGGARDHRCKADYERSVGTPVLGVIAGVVGCLEAAEALKLLLGIGTSLVGRLLVINALDMHCDEIAVKRDPACPVCSRWNQI